MKKIGLMTPYTFGAIRLKNRIVMAPMTRSRAIHNIPNELMAEFYSQRTAAGLIITEGTSPSPNGLGYSRIPGIFSGEQVEGWKKITNAVHAKEGKIFLQVMHTGRISHMANMSEGSIIISPSAVRPAGQMWTDSLGLQDFPVPTAMSEYEIQHTIREYANSAVNAIQSGFDGVELHGANGYLLEQFLSPVSNLRTDRYGGSIENRCLFVLEVIQAVCDVVGKASVGIRLSPYGTAGDMSLYADVVQTYRYLAEEIDRKNILYIHLVDHHSMGAPEVPVSIKQEIRSRFHGTLILGGGHTKESAGSELAEGHADLISFGRPFINNPDLVERFKYGRELSTVLDTTTFYSPGAKGYTDYPVSAG